MRVAADRQRSNKTAICIGVDVIAETLAYEDLRGSSGRSAFFRPQRYGAMDIFPNPPPQVIFGDMSWRISDISLNGIAITSKNANEEHYDVGDLVPLAIEQQGVSLFKGRAIVKRIEPEGFGSKIALHFHESYIDIASLKKRDAHARLRAHFNNLKPSRHDLISRDYRVLCSDILSTFRSYRSFLEQRCYIADQSTPDTSGAFELCLEQLLPQWREFWLRGNEATEAVMGDPESLNAMKSLSELVITPELRVGPIWDRSYAKPLGYPGDYQVMNYVYDWGREGSTTYGQLIHRLGLDVAECIGTRMDVVIDTVMRIAEMKQPGSTARILSLGSGPAREVGQVFQKTQNGSTKIEYTLVDQEEQALQYAYETNYPAATCHRSGASINCLNLSFTDILRGNLSDTRAFDQDMVYSVGLFDYLKDRRARSLAASLFDLVKPGGLLVLGNMNKCEMSNLWPMECLTDWRLYYRDDAEMLGWAEGLDMQSAWTETEPTGRVRLLFVRKSGGERAAIAGE